MKLLTRYVVREHVGPLLFALSALTSLLMLQYVARQLANLAGKGLPWRAIVQFFVLSLPFTVAMTLPMAVLVATLYAFGRMAAEHEITAFKASGIRVRTLMLPVMGCAFLLSLAMVGFNDQILARANHRLRILQQDISRTKPTLALRDQVLNALTEQFYIRVARSDAESNRMWDVVIYDLSRGPERKTVYADSGLFLVAPNGKDLQLRLFHGHSQAFVKGDPRRFQRDFFQEQTVQVRGITQGFEASRADNYKGDREMTVCEMQRKYAVSAREYARARQEYIMYASRVVAKGTKTITVPRPRPLRDALADFYCTTLPGIFLPASARAAAAPTTRGQDTTRGTTGTVQPAVPPKKDTGATTGGAATTGAVTVPSVTVPPAPPVTSTTVPAAPPVAAPVPTVVSPSAEEQLEASRGELLAATARLSEARDTVDGVAVEIQKKFALSFACLVFVLFGPPIALRFPRGGVGVTLGVSIVVFGLYYICLMGGEALADKGMLPASVAMWIANVIFALAGLILVWRVESTTDTSRGGGLADWWAARKAAKAAKAITASAVRS
ncbi:MAG: LptF/LptG family permease [Gemmatimonadaceae bacterium]